MERDGSSSRNDHNSINKNIPISSVSSLMRPIPPRLAKISVESKEYIRSCTVEFIRIVTSEANERCNREQRRTITSEDLKWAMSSLGFHNYVKLVTPDSKDKQISNNAAIGEHMVGGDPSLPPRGMVPQHEALPYGAHGGEAVHGGEANGEGDDGAAAFDPLDFLNCDCDTFF